MKKLTQIFATALILLAFQFQTTKANTIFEKDSKTDALILTVLSYNNSIGGNDLLITENPELVLAAKRISKNTILNRQKTESNLNTDFEDEIQLEVWMSNVEDNTWLADKEESLQLENWMLDPCSWICTK